MSLIFWLKTRDTGHTKQEVAIPVTEYNPLPIRIINYEDDATPEFKVAQLYLPPLSGNTKMTDPMKVPGIGTGSAYTDGDALGTLLTFHNVFRAERCSGVITGVLYFDRDDEGLNMDLPLFSRSFTTTADNSAFAITDEDLLAWRGTIAISTWYNWNVNQTGIAKDVGLWIQSDSPNLYAQLVARGAVNIAAGAEPYIALLVVPD